VYTRNTGACARESAAAAQAILSAAVAQTGANNAGAHRSDNYMSLNYSATPSVLVEMGYLSNAAEDVKRILQVVAARPFCPTLEIRLPNRARVHGGRIRMKSPHALPIHLGGFLPYSPILLFRANVKYGKMRA
jgi:hypothetical protein